MDPRVTEFQCIMPLKNIPSVLHDGILSNERSAKLPHRSVAMAKLESGELNVAETKRLESAAQQ